MGIHYTYGANKGSKLMEKKAKRERKLAEKRAKKQAKSGFVKEKKEYFMSIDWDLTWKILQIVALLIIAREIDKRIRKRKNK